MPASSRSRTAWLGAAALAALTLLAYLPALRAGFVWDDDSTLTGNPLIPAADGLRRIWLTTQPSDYWPVTLSSFWAEWRLWGPHPLGYHAVNLALHGAGVLLFWAVLRRLRIPGAWFGAALFALHPVNVESVAWITQRKNLLAMLGYLGSIYFFLRRAKPWDRWAWLSLASFALAMLSKGSAAILPLVLLGILTWRRRVGARDLLELAPFFAVAAGLTGVNIWFQGHYLAAGASLRHAGLAERLAGAGAVVWFYLGKALLPIRLSFVYPQWRIVPSNPLWWIPSLAAAAVTVVLVKVGRLVPKPPGALGTTRPTPSRPTSSRPARYLLYAWLYFCVALIPVMGFADVYFMRYSLVADHYQHLALLGVAALAGAAWSAARARSRAADAAGLALLAACGILTWRRAAVFHDSESLYLATLRQNPSAWMAHNNLASALAASGRYAEALAHYDAAERLEPGAADIRANRAYALARMGRAAEAQAEFERAIALDPREPSARTNYGNLLLSLGRPAEAVPQFEAALRLEPPEAPGEFNLALALSRSGQAAGAAEHYAAALRLEPGFPGARVGLANALARAGRYEEAARQFEAALRSDPGNPELRYRLGLLLQALGRGGEARAQFQAAGRFPPGG